MKRVSVQREDFDPGAEQALMEGQGAGAIASFTGIVRGDGRIVRMTLEHYPGMTERALSTLVDEAEVRWPLSGIIIVHRFGPLLPGDRIVHVACASSHRKAALEACAFLIDQLKTNAPFWKREEFSDGTSNWVEAKLEDDLAASKWSRSRSEA